jgi:hypothetical protein
MVNWRQSVIKIPDYIRERERSKLYEIMCVLVCKGLRNRPAKMNQKILIDISDYNSIRFESNVNADY